MRMNNTESFFSLGLNLSVIFKKFKSTRSGFTLIELLVVIAIISLLSSVVMASLNSAREKAAVVNIVTNLRQVEKAFFLLADDENISLWWSEANLAGINPNPNISLLITDANRLGKFLKAAPSMPIGTDMGYDNDGDVFVCGDGGTTYRGVNIHIRNVPLEIAQKVNMIVDRDADINCGRIKWDSGGGGSLFYVLSESYLNF